MVFGGASFKFDCFTIWRHCYGVLRSDGQGGRRMGPHGMAGGQCFYFFLYICTFGVVIFELDKIIDSELFILTS